MCCRATFRTPSSSPARCADFDQLLRRVPQSSSGAVSNLAAFGPGGPAEILVVRLAALLELDTGKRLQASRSRVDTPSLGGGCRYL